VDDARLASATKMIVEDVRDWLETLESKNGKGSIRLDVTDKSPEW
jgi:hypothetical protein